MGIQSLWSGHCALSRTWMSPKLITETVVPDPCLPVPINSASQYLQTIPFQAGCQNSVFTHFPSSPLNPLTRLPACICVCFYPPLTTVSHWDLFLLSLNPNHVTQNVQHNTCSCGSRDVIRNRFSHHFLFRNPSVVTDFQIEVSGDNLI